MCLIFILLLGDSAAFAPCAMCHNCSPAHFSAQLFLSPDGSADDKDLMNKLNSRVEEIKVEKARTKLEEENIRSFLKRKPRKLPYEDARRWVQGNLGCASREEFDDLVENGNLRTPYIPKRPEEYYTATREWISWEHFLNGCFDDQNPSNVKPQTGVFD